MILLKGDMLRRPPGSESRLCVGSMEPKNGALNGQVKIKGPRESGTESRELCSPPRKRAFPFHCLLCCSHCELHPYSEVSVLTRSHFLGSQVVRTVSPVRLDGELWVSGITLAPWGSQLLSEGRNPGQGALGASEAGAQVLPAALLGGGISEQKGEGRNSPAQD